MAFEFLSYRLDPTDPVWPGAAALTIESDAVLGVDGSPYNTAICHLPNHFGTHFDAPLHFNPNGPPLCELDADYFAYKGNEVFVLDVPKNAREIITLEDVLPHGDKIKSVRLLLFHSGFSKLRRVDASTYQGEGPCIHPDVARWLVENCPQLMCIGVDFISIGSPCNALATDTHQWLLGCRTNKFITAIEDMDMEPLVGKKINFIALGPLRIVGADSGQVSIIADLEPINI